MDDHILRDLAAKQAIAECLYRYCRGLDRMDRTLADTVWHPDGTADYGADLYQGSGSGFLDFVWKRHEAMAGHSHLLGNILIDVHDDGRTASSESYVSLWARMPVTDGMVRDTFVRSRYIDRLSCRDGRWAIDHRVMVSDMARTTELPAVGVNADPMESSRRDATDPSYAA